MSDEEFAALVAKLEGQARSNPARYRVKVLLLAMLGNAYLAGILLLIAALFAAAVASVAVVKGFAVKIILVIGAFLCLIVKVAWIRIPPPQGIEIDQAQAPELFAMIEALRQALCAPAFHHVLVVDEFNAGVVQTPSFGPFGGNRNYLLIGLPLMKALTLDQFRAVLAHEFGHLAQGHSRLSNWIYRQRLRWGRLMGLLDANESQGRILFKPFLHWFTPYFNAYSFPLARANEYEADAASVRLTSPTSAAAALTSVDVLASYLEERYWPGIHKQADDVPQPHFAPFAGMDSRIATELDRTSTSVWMDQAMARKTTLEDTHPALADRLAAIGESPQLALPAVGEAADRLLGAALPGITAALDQRWKQNILPAWAQRHDEVQTSRQRFAELNAKYASGAELTLQEAYDRARLTETVGSDPDATFTQLRALHDRAPDDAIVGLTLGARLLARDDDAGHALVERATQLDDSVTLEACEILRNHHWRNGRHEQAHAWHGRLLERAQLEQAAENERNQILINDKFEPHELPAEIIEQLRSKLRSIEGLRKAYLVRKAVKLLPGRACYLLGFSVTGLLQFHSEKRAAAVQQRIRTEVQFAGETLIINVEGSNAPFERKLRNVHGAEIV